MTTKVVTVSIQAHVDGNVLAVQGATITLGVNAIPRIELQCAPSNDASYVPLQPTVKKPTISDFADLYRELSVKAEGLNTTGNVSIMLEDNLGKSDFISLNEWILSGVGLSSVSATAAPYLSVVLQHPICKLTKVGSIYETQKSKIDKKLNEATKSANDFLEVITAVYKCIREGVDFWPAPNDLPKKFRDELGVGDYDPNKYLKFKGENGIFLGKAVKDGKERLAQAMGRLALPSSGGSSTWDMLVSASGTLLLSITQDRSCNYTKEHLVLEPTQPWKNSSMTLRDEDCFWTEIPGMDPFKIAGVMARKLGPYSDEVGLGLIRNGNPNQKDPVEEVMYVPVPAESITTADGRIMKTSAPAVLDSAFRRDAPYGSGISLGSIDLDKAREDGFNTAIEKYCKAVYEITAASMIHARAQMALWFTDADGNLLLPGNTCKFTSNGKEIYYGYVRQVIHHLSTGGGCATTLAMSYVRPEASFKVAGQVAIAAGSKNAVYE